MLKFNPMTPPFAHRLIYGVPSSSGPSHLTTAYSVLDGQQRISSVYYAFRHPSVSLPKGKKPYRFFLKLGELLDEDFDEAVAAEPEGSPEFRTLVDEWIRGEALPFGPVDPSFLPEGASPPYLKTLYDLLSASSGAFLQAYLMGTESPYLQEQGKLSDFLSPLLDYAFVAIVISFSSIFTPSDVIRVIAPLFVNVNSKGTRLTLFDLAVAHLFPVLHGHVNLRDLWNDLPTTHPGLETFIEGEWIDPDDLLRIMALITGGSVKKNALLEHLHRVASDLTTGKTVTSPAGHTFTSFRNLWDEAASCLEKACNRVINDYGALKPQWIPYTSMLVPLAALIHVEKISRDPNARKKVDCWYWHSVFYERYEKSVDTTAMADFHQVTGWILGTSDKPSWISGAVPPGLDLKSEQDRKSTIFKAVLNLIALAGAKNLLNGGSPGTNLQLDHMFPKDSAKPWSRHKWINSVLNFTLLESSVNKAKKSKDPDVFYSSNMVLEHRASGRSVRNTFRSHLIGPGAEKAFSKASSTSPSAVSEFEKFIEEREKDVLTAIQDQLSPCVEPTTYPD